MLSSLYALQVRRIIQAVCGGIVTLLAGIYGTVVAMTSSTRAGFSWWPTGALWPVPAIAGVAVVVWLAAQFWGDRWGAPDFTLHLDAFDNLILTRSRRRVALGVRYVFGDLDGFTIGGIAYGDPNEMGDYKPDDARVIFDDGTKIRTVSVMWIDNVRRAAGPHRLDDGDKIHRLYSGKS